VGTGIEGWVDSKMQGTRQLLQVLTGRVARPIPSGIASGKMVPSSETCERCHWTERPAALKLQVHRAYAEDEANTPETTVLTLHVGGTHMGGIHGAHATPGVEIRFVATDPARQDVPLVEYHDTETGERRTYVRKGVDPASYADAERVTMSCIDCHNRAAHAFQSPDRAVDLALTFGLVSSSLPFLKQQGLELLRRDWGSAEEARRGIPAALADYYRAQHPDVLASRAGDVEEAGRVLAGLWARNVFPELGVTWGTYPDNRGHSEQSPGCFRCHAGNHETADGQVLTQDCFRCHAASAVGEEDPEILRLLGLSRPIERMQRR
jgi:cytochrome c553